MVFADKVGILPAWVKVHVTSGFSDLGSLSSAQCKVTVSLKKKGTIGYSDTGDEFVLVGKGQKMCRTQKLRGLIVCILSQELRFREDHMITLGHILMEALRVDPESFFKMGLK